MRSAHQRKHLQECSPDVLLNLVTRTQPFDFESERLDAAIHYGVDDWPGVISHRLIGDEIVLFCAPGYLERRRLTTFRCESDG